MISEIEVLESGVNGADAKVAIAVCRFNQFINQPLLEGALDALQRIGSVKKENITVVWVPGAYELPLVAKKLANRQRFSAIIALATIIRGSTAHFDYVAGPSSANLANIATQCDTPIAFGMLTTDTIEQAIERAGTKMGNKGAEAALVALEMINILKKIDTIV